MKLLKRAHLDGTQELHRFSNGFGASVVKHCMSYGNEDGLYEIAVIKFHGEGVDDYFLTYTTPITDDVLGRVPKEKIGDVLREIESL